MPITYTIRVHAIPLSDDDGKRACSVTPETLTSALEAVNDVFEQAHLRFAFDPATDWKPRKSTSLNRLHNGPSGSEWWKEANEVAAGLRGRLTLFLRWGSDPAKAASNWFAYPPDTGQTQPPLAKLPHENIDFVAITNQSSKFSGSASSGCVLAHEIGHYLGLFHTHPGWGTTSVEKVIELVKDQGAAGLDGDGLSDTPPDCCIAYYAEKVSGDLCGGPKSFKIEGVTIEPDRLNLMSYYNGCHPPAILSPQQVQVIRATLQHEKRKHLIEYSAGVRYAGIFSELPGKQALWVGDDWPGFKAKWEELDKKGLRLVDLDTYVIDSKRRYTGVFEAGHDEQALWVGDDWPGFKAKWEELHKKNLRLIDLETWLDGKTRRYAGVFREGTYQQALWVGDDWPGFKAKWEELHKKNLRLIDLETWLDGKTRRYAGIFHEGTYQQALWVGEDWAGFEAKWQELYKKNLRLVDIETWLDGKTRRYAGVFHAGTYVQALWVGDDWFGFEQQWNAQAKKGRRLVDIEVYGSKVD
jgi:Bacterial tandem repeat domain 1